MNEVTPNINLVEIELSNSQTHDLLSRLRHSWFGCVYRRYLKKISLIRWMAIRIWIFGNRVIQVLMLIHPVIRQQRRWRKLLRLQNFVAMQNTVVEKLVASSLVEPSKAKVFPNVDQAYLVPLYDRFEFPEISVVHMNQAVIYGGSNLILHGEDVLCHDLYNFESDTTSEELHGRIRLDPIGMRIRWLMHDEEPVSVSVAATFLDACAGNYAHWMTEILPRIAVFCSDHRFKSIPIVVDAELHSNIMESIALLAGTKREVLALPVGRALAVDDLYVTSAVGYVPFGRRGKSLGFHSHGIFSPAAFLVLRESLREAVNVPTEKRLPEKIFLRRISGARKLINTDEIEAGLVARGYEVVETERLTFSEQVALFSRVKEIVAPTGAALANAIVCQPGTAVTVLMSKHEDMIYGYWSNLLSPLQINVNYILGNEVDGHPLGIHADYVINSSDLDDFLDWRKGE